MELSTTSNKLKRVTLLFSIFLATIGCNYSETAPAPIVSTNNAGLNSAEVTPASPTIPIESSTSAPLLPTDMRSATFTNIPTAVPTDTPSATFTNTPTVNPSETPTTDDVGLLLPEETTALTGLIVCNRQGEIFAVDETGNLITQPDLPQAGEFHFNNNIYFIRNADVWVRSKVSGEMQSLIETEDMDEQLIYGRLGEWLLVRASLTGQDQFQSPGPIFLFKLDGSEYQLLVDDSVIGEPLLSEDGTLAIISNQDEVWLIDESLTQTSPFAQHFYFGAISPNNQYVAHGGARLGISDLSTGDLIAEYEYEGSLRVGDISPEPFQWSSDNEWVAVQTFIQAEPPDFPSQLLVFNIITGEAQTISNAWNPRWHPKREMLLFATNPPRPHIQLLRFSGPSWEIVETGYEGLPVTWITQNNLPVNSQQHLPVDCN